MKSRRSSFRPGFFPCFFLGFGASGEANVLSNSVACWEPVMRSFSPQPNTSVARAAVCAIRSA